MMNEFKPLLASLETAASAFSHQSLKDTSDGAGVREDKSARRKMEYQNCLATTQPISRC
jgi:hypothetical protein